MKTKLVSNLIVFICCSALNYLHIDAALLPAPMPKEQAAMLWQTFADTLLHGTIDVSWKDVCKIFPEKCDEEVKDFFVSTYLSGIQPIINAECMLDVFQQETALFRQMFYLLQPVKKKFFCFVTKKYGKSAGNAAGTFLKESWAGPYFYMIYFVPLILLEADYAAKFPAIYEGMKEFIAVWKKDLYPHLVHRKSNAAETVAYLNAELNKLLTSKFKHFQGNFIFFKHGNPSQNEPVIMPDDLTSCDVKEDII
jgi:hypothetical protein